MDILINGILGINGFGLLKSLSLADDVGAIGGCDVAFKKSDLKNEYVKRLAEAASSLDKIRGKYDVIIDFSSRFAAKAISEYVLKTCTPALILTTGHTDEELNLLKRAAKVAPVAVIKNASKGIPAIVNALDSIKNYLDGFSVGITEVHRKNKTDIPSGTALYIQDRLAETMPNSAIQTNSVRVFDTPGIHEITFYDGVEKIVLKHEVLSREAFYRGAKFLAEKLASMPENFYTDKDF